MYKLCFAVSVAGLVTIASQSALCQGADTLTTAQQVGLALARLQPGKQIRVHTLGLERLQGPLVGSSETTIRLRTDASETHVPVAEIDSLWLRGNRAGTGALVGAVTLSLLGAAAGKGLAQLAENPNTTGPTVAGLAIGAAGGALLGALIGWAIPTWQLQVP